MKLIDFEGLLDASVEALSVHILCLGLYEHSPGFRGFEVILTYFQFLQDSVLKFFYCPESSTVLGSVDSSVCSAGFIRVVECG